MKTFTSNQGLGHNETVTCEIVRIEKDDVYGRYISSVGVDQDDIDLRTPFSLSGLILEGNQIDVEDAIDSRMELIEILNNVIKYCESEQIYDKLGNYGDFYRSKY